MNKLLSTLGVVCTLCVPSLWADDCCNLGCPKEPVVGPCAEKPHCLKLSAPASCGYPWCDDVAPFCGDASFHAKGCETRKIKIGGLIQTGYQFVDVSDDEDNNSDPDEYSNFMMKHIRLCVNAHLGNGWSGLMNVDFAGKSAKAFDSYEEANGGALMLRSCACKDQCKVFVDKAYIQKEWLDATLRFGYQKVNWGAEEVTPESQLKTIERSVATNFFMNMGHRANAGGHRQYSGARTLRWVGQKFGSRHVGIHVAGDAGCFHYSAALVNGYQGICMNSDAYNNELGFFGSLGFDFGIDDMDFMLGVNAGFKPKGSNSLSTTNNNVYGFNPYIMANWCSFSFLGELFWGSVEEGKVTSASGDADPWGFNAIGSYMLNDCWELVGRFSYVNSDEMGMTICNTFGCAPDNGKRLANPGMDNGTFVSSDILFEKVYAGYVGVNYYMMNGAVKLSAGFEQAKFKNRGSASANIVTTPITFGGDDNKSAKVNAARACIQFLF